MIGYDRRSETERVWVNDEGLTIQSLLKIQSDPFGNIWDFITAFMQSSFDGDEMNMHIAQNVLAETELRHLAAIPYQIISPGSSSPIVGIFPVSYTHLTLPTKRIV